MLFSSGEPTICLAHSDARTFLPPRTFVVERSRANSCSPIECSIIHSTCVKRNPRSAISLSHISFSLWLQKLVLLDTYRRLLRQLRWEKVTMISYIGIFAATYVTVQTVTFTECDPFSHYWIVLPDPGISFPLLISLLFSCFVEPSNQYRQMLPGTAPIDRPRYASSRKDRFNVIPLTF